MNELDRLFTAAFYLTVHGWGRGGQRNGKGTPCMIDALYAACDDDSAIVARFRPFLREVIRQRYAPHIAQDSINIAIFNDRYVENKAEAIHLFLAASDAWREATQPYLVPA